MRVIFAGTPEFAAETLQALLATEHEICAVYTQPDRPSGRGRKLTASPVKTLALEHNIPVEQPLNFKEESAQQRLRDYEADLMIVVAYGLLLPQIILDTPKRGCINVHASLLPRWRGAAPIQRAILAGDPETGVCIMQMEAGLDTGPVLNKAACLIHAQDTTQLLHDRLAVLGAKTLIASLQDLPTLQATAQIQDDELSCYASKMIKSEAEIDWQQSAVDINRQIHAFNPWPVAQTVWQDKVFRIWLSDIVEYAGNEKPGTVITVDKTGIDIATGSGSEQGALRLTQVQIPGKRAMSVADFLNANTIDVGDILG